MNADVSRRTFMIGSMGLVASASVAASLPDLIPVRPWEPSTDKKIRIGVVGGRFGLSFHWHEHPNCEVAAVSDLREDRRAMLQGKYGCDTVYPSLEELVKDDTLDAVALFTPAPDHARHVQLCMEHGKHVISACPACMTLEEAEAMVETQRSTGRKYMQAETSYFRWETIVARELFEAGVFGEMIYCEGEYYHPGIGRDEHDLSRENGKPTWRYGFPPMLYPTHSTAFLVGVTGERLVNVSCIGTGNDDEPALKDNAYDNPFLNGMALFETDKGHPFRCNVCWDIHADGERAQWFGRDASLYMPGYSGQPFALKKPHETLTELPDLWNRVPEAMRYNSGHGSSHPFLTNEFVMALIEDRDPAINLEMALAFCVPGIVAHQSALHGGKRLDIPQFAE